MNKLLDELTKYGPIVFTALAAILTRQQEKKDQIAMANKISRDVLRGLRK